LNKEKTMKKIVLIFQLLCLSGIASFAQTGGNTTVTTQDGNAQSEFLTVREDEWKRSLRPDGIIDKVPHRNYVIPYDRVRENDVMWRKRIWRMIDVRQKQNEAFRYAGVDEEAGGGLFIEILIDAIKRGDVQAFDVMNDRFTTPINYEAIKGKMTGRPDTLIIQGSLGQDSMVITQREFDPEKVIYYRVKEDIVFDRVLGRAVTRIIGIAPIYDKYDENGEFRGQQTLFWIYFPDLRPSLAKYKVYNSDNDEGRITWDDYFQKHMFSSFIYKSTMNNLLGQDVKEYKSGVDKIYTSDKVKETLFNKESDMWVH
jgi:gliding motility associated protien GldN